MVMMLYVGFTICMYDVGFTSNGLSSSYLSPFVCGRVSLLTIQFVSRPPQGGGHPPKHPALWGSPGSPHTPHHLLPPHHHPGTSPNQLSVPPDPFNRKISRHPKKFLTQSSSRFQPQKPPPDYKPLPHLKGREYVSCMGKATTLIVPSDTHGTPDSELGMVPLTLS